MTTEKITVTFEGWDEERIVEAVAQKLAEKTDARVKEQVQKLVEAAVAKAVEKTTAKRIGELVEAVMVEGLPVPNNYGEVTAQRRTVLDVVRSYLALGKTDGYGKTIASVAAQTIEKHVAFLWDKELTETREALKAELKRAVNEKVAGGFMADIRRAVGLPST